MIQPLLASANDGYFIFFIKRILRFIMSFSSKKIRYLLFTFDTINAWTLHKKNGKNV